MLPYQPQHPQTYPVPAGSIPPGITETYMELAPKNKKEMLKLVGSKERIYYAGMVDKVNKHDNPQRRVLVITDKSVYNIDPDTNFFSSLALCTPAGGFRIKRKISIPKVFGVTLSVNPTSEHEQFIIHVQGEYDYRYNAGQKREKIIKSLMNSHFAQSNVPFVLFCRDEADLAKFHTNDDDLKEKKDKRPKEGKILVTPDLAQRGLDWIIFNRNNLVNMTVCPNNGNNGGNNNGNMPHPNQGFPGGPYPGPYNGPYNGPNNFSGPYPQNQGQFPQAGGFQHPYNGHYGNQQPNHHMPGPQPYQPYSPIPQNKNMNPGFQQPYPNAQPQPQAQPQGYYGQPNFNQNQNGLNRAHTMPNQPTNFAPAPVPNSTQATIQIDVRATNYNPNNNNVQLNTNYEPSKNQFAPSSNQYNGNYPPQNQNFGGPGNARNY